MLDRTMLADPIKLEPSFKGVEEPDYSPRSNLPQYRARDRSIAG
jgi:hypothetical protein